MRLMGSSRATASSSAIETASGPTHSATLSKTLGVRIVLTPVQAPNANAYAERFVRSIREECLDRLILFGKQRLLRALDEYVAHYYGERNHQGLENELIMPETRPLRGTRVRCRERLGGLLRYYHRAA
jgi:putative transposase